MRVFFYSIHGFDKPFFEQQQGQHYFEFTEKSLSESTVEMAAGFDAIALFSSDTADEKILLKLAQLHVKYISLRSVGYDHVNLQLAKSLQIKVANVPEYSPYAIAEHAVAMLLCLNRKLIRAQELIQVGDFRLDSLIGFDLHGKTVGVIGTGKIGFNFARIMHGFGCKVVACDPLPNLEANLIGMHYVTLDELLRAADIVSLHCPLNEHTHYLLNEEQFTQMKKDAVLINTARGAVVNTDALIKALDNGIISGACLDVYEHEKGLFFYDYRKKGISDAKLKHLLAMKNVLVTGHQAFLTREALQGITDTTLANINQWEANGVSENDLF